MATRTQILETSLQLFLERGCKNVTMDDVASENGMSKRTLYEMFKDKSSLLEEGLTTLYNRKLESINHLLDNNENVLRMLLEAIDSEDEKVLDTHQNFMMDVRKYYPELHKKFIVNLYNSQYNMLVKMLEQGHREGLFIKEGISYENVAFSLMTIANIGYEYKSNIGMKTDPRKALAETSLLLIRGLATGAGIEIIDNHIKNKLR